MTVSSGEQMSFFICSLLAGVICGIVFDWMRSCRKIFGCGKVALAFQDLLFSFICIIMTVGICFLYNKGRVRYFEILGIISGALFYAVLLSRVVMMCFCGINRFIVHIAIRPIIKLVCFIIGLMKKIMNEIFRIMGKIKSFLKKTAKKLSQKRKKIKKRIKML